MLAKPVTIGEYGYMPFPFVIMKVVNKSEIYID